MFPQFSNLSQHPWNGVYLTARQHFIAHIMLWRAFKNEAMRTAVLMMKGKNRNGILYEKMKKEQSAARQGKPLREDTKKKISSSLKGKPGKPISEETRKKMSIAQQGKPISEETRKKMSISRKGGSLSKETRKKLSIAHQGKQHTKEVKEKMSIAHQGKSGKPHGKETRKKMSIAHQGKRHTEETKEKISGENHYRFEGVFHTPFGAFNSASAASSTSTIISRYSILNWCKLNTYKTVSDQTYSKSKFLQDNYDREDIVNKKTYRDLGFSFIEK
jgi:hypothetical protein